MTRELKSDVMENCGFVIVFRPIAFAVVKILTSIGMNPRDYSGVPVERPVGDC